MAPVVPRAVVLLSGGLDSATTLGLALRDGFSAHALTVRYGQRHSIEVERAAALARLLGSASHEVVWVDLSFAGGSALTDRAIAVPKSRPADEIGRAEPPVTYVPARNTVLLALALAWAEVLGAEDIFIGVNAVDYSGYPDCRPAFIEAFEALAAVATRAGTEGRRFRIRAPLLHMAKGQIVRLASAVGVDFRLALSCYDPGSDGTPCGACDACILRARGFREAGMADPAAERGGSA